MPDGSVQLLIAIIVLVLLSAFFSSTETAFSCSNKIKLHSLASNGNKRARLVVDLVENKFDKLISTILVGNNIVNIAAATISTLFFAKILQGKKVDFSLISTIVTTIVVLIFGEITPKFIAKTQPEKTSMVYYPVVIFFYYVLFPFNFIFSGWRWLIAKIFRFKPADVVTEAEIITMVEEAEEDGTLGNEETKLIRSVIEFDDLEVGDILVPRVNIIALDINSSMEDIKKVFCKEGYSRIPVYKNTIDTIIGTIHEKDFFNAYLMGKKNIEGILQNAFYTTEHAKISVLLKQLQKNKVHIAVVLDEYGGTLGILTLEDILEELVGEIYDEHDEEVNYFKQISENVFTVDGNAQLDDMFEYFSFGGDEDNFEANTVSGWITEILGEIPPANTSIDYKNLKIEVVKATVKRVLLIKVTILDSTESIG